MFYLDLFRCLHERGVRYLLAVDLNAAFGRAVIQMVDDAPVRIASIDDMIALKQDTGRRQDADDVEHLLRLKGQS